MRSVIFDAGPIISLTTNNLLWLLKELKNRYNGSFLIAEAVKRELVDKPLTIKRFEFEALQVLNCINEGIIGVVDEQQIRQKTEELLALANNCFRANNYPISIVHYGEMAGLAVSITQKSDAFAVDERTTRLLIENPKRLAHILQHKLHIGIDINRNTLKKLGLLIKNVRVIRSAELAAVAYELGILDKFLADIKDPRETLLDSVLWGVKLNGCSISQDEIKQIINLETSGFK